MQPAFETVPRDPGRYVRQTGPVEKGGVRNAVAPPEEIGQEKGGKGDNPWKRQRSSAGFEPEAWSPGVVKR